MAADVDVWFRWFLQSAAPALASKWRIFLPLWAVLAVWCLWVWLPKLLVGLVTRISRKYLRQTSSNAASFTVHATGGEQKQCLTRSNKQGNPHHSEQLCWM